MVRIVAGTWRGRTIAAPRSEATRPTADRVRQALFDMLSHAPWADPMQEHAVLDGFAGSGALGLEALSRGAPRAVFFETDRVALDSLRANIASLDAGPRCSVVAADATKPPRAAAQGACTLVFLDPPYGNGLIARSLDALRTSGWVAAGALIVAETAREEDPPVFGAALLAERRHGAARISIWRG
jgi:16S rRNA (guanine966-N2)-methyltransferase